MEISTLIRHTRKSLGLSQQEFAKALGLKSGQVVSNWERNYGPLMSVKVLQKLVKKFNLHEDKVLEMYMVESKRQLIHKIERQFFQQQKPLRKLIE